MLRIVPFQLLLCCLSFSLVAQTGADPGLLTIDRIFASPEFQQEPAPHIQWISGGDAYVITEVSASDSDREDLVRYDTKTQVRSLFIASEKLIPPGESIPMAVEEFTLSPDESKVLIFTNSSRVWRSNTKGDYWVFDLTTQKLSRLGARFPESSLMFAKFSNDNRFVAYVHNFNIYKENFTDDTVTQLTFDGTGDIINGTFDWVYEEEFSCRDGFRWNTTGSHLAFWQLDASQIGTFYMINNTDSVYSTVIPVQYPKAGQPPSACKVGIICTSDAAITWIPVPGDEKENYLPRMQWISNDLLLIQQINRRQNNLKFHTYNIKTRELKNIYEERESTFVDIAYPDVSADDWEMEDLIPVNTGQEVLRLSETGGWRHLIKINLYTGQITNLTPGRYDVARFYAAIDRYAYFNASPANSTQRYLYRVSLSGKGDTVRLTPPAFTGVNLYRISPNGMYAVHTHSNSKTPKTVELINIPGHKGIKVLAANASFKEKIRSLTLPSSGFFSITTADGVSMDGFMAKPPDFDPAKKYPVLFYVYGEPWEQVAADKWPSNLWQMMLVQRGYILIALDNRGSPCLKGSAWRKSIYGKEGVINSIDQAMAAAEVLQWSFVDTSRIAVWGWSGGGSMTLNLMFRYPEIYKTGMAVAPVSDLRTYDNIYQERYMGLPQENITAYHEGSPINYAGNLKGNLLVVHGTGDDNVHYQNTEMLVNELIRKNKHFTMMSYPNRSHSIYEGKNTTKHLFSLLTLYLIDNCPPGGR
ncbi:MAG TPA: DPP IV N-terminal domain-containing protein [Bacteroidales bacterium]|nr:DPP IV N-terminal domain-containing protein [Bacteroidales bacterium]